MARPEAQTDESDDNCLSDCFSDTIVECVCADDGEVSFEVHSAVLALSSPVLCSAMAFARTRPTMPVKWQIRLNFYRNLSDRLIHGNDSHLKRNSYHKHYRRLYGYVNTFRVHSSVNVNFELVFMHGKFNLNIEGLNLNVVLALFNVFYFEDWRVKVADIHQFLCLLQKLQFDCALDYKHYIKHESNSCLVNEDWIHVSCEAVRTANSETRGLRLLARFFTSCFEEHYILQAVTDFQNSSFALFSVAPPRFSFTFSHLNLRCIMNVLSNAQPPCPAFKFEIVCSKLDGNLKVLYDVFKNSNLVIHIVATASTLSCIFLKNPVKITFDINVSEPMLMILKTAGGMGVHIDTLDQLMGGPIKQAINNLKPVLRVFDIEKKSALLVAYKDEVNDIQSSAKRKSALYSLSSYAGPGYRIRKSANRIKSDKFDNEGDEPPKKFPRSSQLLERGNHSKIMLKEISKNVFSNKFCENIELSKENYLFNKPCNMSKKMSKNYYDVKYRRRLRSNFKHDLNVHREVEPKELEVLIKSSVAYRQKLRRCPACGLRFVSKKQLLVHMQQLHLKATSDDTKGGPCVDSRCPVTINIFNEVTHLLKHVIQALHDCHFCSFSCGSRSTLMRHLQKHEMYQRDFESQSLQSNERSNLRKKNIPSPSRKPDLSQSFDYSLLNDMDESLEQEESMEKLLTFNKIVKPRKSKSQRPRPKGVPAQHLGIRLSKYEEVETKENTDEEIASYKPPTSCFVCGLNFDETATPVSMSLHYYEQHRKGTPRKCPFPKCPLMLRQAALLLEHVRHHLWLRRYSCTVCSYSASSSKTIKLHARAHAHFQAHGSVIYKPHSAFTKSQKCGCTFGRRGRPPHRLSAHHANKAERETATTRPTFRVPASESESLNRSWCAKTLPNDSDALGVPADVSDSNGEPVSSAISNETQHSLSPDRSSQAVSNASFEEQLHCGKISCPAPPLAARKFLHRPSLHTVSISQSPSLNVHDDGHAQKREAWSSVIITSLADESRPNFDVKDTCYNNAQSSDGVLNVPVVEPFQISCKKTSDHDLCNPSLNSLQKMIGKVPSSITVTIANSSPKSKDSATLTRDGKVVENITLNKKHFQASLDERADENTERTSGNNEGCNVTATRHSSLPQQNVSGVSSRDDITVACPHCSETKRSTKELCLHFVECHSSKSEFFCPFCVFSSVPKNVTRLGRSNFKADCVKHLLYHYTSKNIGWDKIADSLDKNTLIPNVTDSDNTIYNEVSQSVQSETKVCPAHCIKGRNNPLQATDAVDRSVLRDDSKADLYESVPGIRLSDKTFPTGSKKRKAGSYFNKLVPPLEFDMRDSKMYSSEPCKKLKLTHSSTDNFERFEGKKPNASRVLPVDNSSQHNSPNLIIDSDQTVSAEENLVGGCSLTKETQHESITNKTTLHQTPLGACEESSSTYGNNSAGVTHETAYNALLANTIAASCPLFPLIGFPQFNPFPNFGFHFNDFLAQPTNASVDNIPLSYEAFKDKLCRITSSGAFARSDRENDVMQHATDNSLEPPNLKHCEKLNSGVRDEIPVKREKEEGLPSLDRNVSSHAGNGCGLFNVMNNLQFPLSLPNAVNYSNPMSMFLPLLQPYISQMDPSSIARFYYSSMSGCQLRPSTFFDASLTTDPQCYFNLKHQIDIPRNSIPNDIYANSLFNFSLNDNFKMNEMDTEQKLLSSLLSNCVYDQFRK